MNKYFVREICDPLYKYIYLTKTENEIVDSKEFQRLDRLYQIPSTRFVFPNATHTRKSHSLGVMYLADIGLKRILYRQHAKMREKYSSLFYHQFVLGDIEELDDLVDDKRGNNKLPMEELKALRIAALCHDIGHGPFSHLFEDVCNSLHEEGKCDKFDHESMSAQIVGDRLNNKIQDEETTEEAKGILLGKGSKFQFLTRIIDGAYDVDKLDYICRDAYHTGASEYGALDYIRIIDGFRVKNGELLISRSSLGSVMNFFTATQYMYTNVYYHKTSRIFDFMFSEAMRMIPEYINELSTDLDEFLDTDDWNFVLKVKHKRDQSNETNDYCTAYKIFKDILDRKKKYRNVFQHFITLHISSNKQEALAKLQNDLEQEYADLKTKVDYSAIVRPIRVDTAVFYNWMQSESIWDETSHKAKNLSEISKSYFEMLKQLQILFYIYVDRKTGLTERIEKLRNDAETRLNKIELVG